MRARFPDGASVRLPVSGTSEVAAELTRACQAPFGHRDVGSGWRGVSYEISMWRNGLWLPSGSLWQLTVS